MERPTCKTCPYHSRGMCFLYPPTVITAVGERDFDYLNRRPETNDDEWCGQHPVFPAYLASLREWTPEQEAAFNTLWNKMAPRSRGENKP